MKTRIILILCIILLSANPMNILGQNTFQRYDSKDDLESAVVEVINDFDLFMKEKGIEAPYIPSVNIRTAPFLIKWDEANKGIILPFWDELLDEQKELFIALKGDDAEEFFISLFNWFLVPHELGHFMNPMEDSISPYKREQAANEFAVAFFLSREEYREKLDYIEKSLPEVLERLPEIDFNSLSEEEYFNLNYTQLGRNPYVYGYFQFKFILDILQNKEDVNILYYFGDSLAVVLE